MLNRRQRHRRRVALAESCVASENVCHFEAQLEESIPPWRWCRSSFRKLPDVATASGAPGNLEQTEISTASPTAESSASFAGAKFISLREQCQKVCCTAGSISNATISVGQFSDGEGSSASESTVAYSGESDDEATALEEELEDSISEPLEGQRLIMALVQALTPLKVEGGSTERSTCFHASRVPCLSVGNYLERIYEYFACSNPCYVLCLIYIDRVLKSGKGFVLNDFSMHRLLLASMVVAAKFHDDEYHSNADYARIGGVTLKSLNKLEKEFLQLLDWQVYVSLDEHDQYMTLLRLQLA